MLNSPLQLETYWITNIQYKMDPGANPENRPELGSDIKIWKNEEDPSWWCVLLKLSFKSKPKKPSTFSGSFEIVGYFQVVEDYSFEPQTLVEFNGPAVLYGIIRDHISNLTSNSPHGRIVLPTVMFGKKQDNTKKKSRKKTSP